ncbi:MAG: peptide deformylase [Bacteroidota bacterium]
MILPIYGFGHPVLKKVSVDIDANYPNIKELIDNMFATMNSSNGVGLAAPQLGLSIRLFIIDTTPFKEDDPSLDGFKKVFINARIIEESGKDWAFNEGCLSVPSIREDVLRKPNIVISYLDENFVEHTENFDGIKARVIQHEYDHIEGKLFVERLSPLKRTLIKGRLNDISKGRTDVNYKMKFVK